MVEMWALRLEHKSKPCAQRQQGWQVVEPSGPGRPWNPGSQLSGICSVLRVVQVQVIWTLVYQELCYVRRRRQQHSTPVLLPGRSHGWRSLIGCSPWGREESDTTERFHFPFSLSCIREGNGDPLQCSCLENPRDGGAAVCGVTQSRTRLKRLSFRHQTTRE